MASLQRVKVKGHSYWRIVESRRVNGKPRLFVLLHLGKADDILARIQGAQSLRLASHSHGAVAAIHALAKELDIKGTIDSHMASFGRRDRRPNTPLKDPLRKPLLHDGLTTGHSLELICINRICHPTSKMAFAQWAKTTTLETLAGVDLKPLTSQHFWDQMDQIPVEALALIEKDIVEKAIERFQIPLDTLLYDATNFFTFIATQNTHCQLPKRGHNKQKRHDLRQVGVALLCNKGQGIPLLSQVYGGNRSDAKSFADVLPSIKQRLLDLRQNYEALTVVYDKGNVSKANQSAVDNAGIHYVTSLTVASQRALVEEANARLEEVELGEDRRVFAYRAQKNIWGAQRTVVVLLSESLREGQLRGINQHLASALAYLKDLALVLERGKQRREKAALERDIQHRLAGRQFLSEVLQVEVSGEGKALALTYQVKDEVLDALAQTRLGRMVLITDRHTWTTAEIILAYRGQARIEEVFGHFKDPFHVALRPQYHWTDQKLHVHTFTCVMGYLLGRLLHLKAQREVGYSKSQERLLDTLETIRKVKVIRAGEKKGLRLTTQLEEMEPEVKALAQALGILG